MFYVLNDTNHHSHLSNVVYSCEYNIYLTRFSIHISLAIKKYDIPLYIYAIINQLDFVFIIRNDQPDDIVSLSICQLLSFWKDKDYFQPKGIMYM